MGSADGDGAVASSSALQFHPSESADGLAELSHREYALRARSPNLLDRDYNRPVPIRGIQALDGMHPMVELLSKFSPLTGTTDELDRFLGRERPPFYNAESVWRLG
jgi:hypothetical protein